MVFAVNQPTMYTGKLFIAEILHPLQTKTPQFYELLFGNIRVTTEFHSKTLLVPLPKNVFSVRSMELVE